MIGSKKLSAIREELRRALKATGDDPIRWLNELMTAPARGCSDTPAASEVLRSLRRFLEGKQRRSDRRQRAGMKK